MFVVSVCCFLNKNNFSKRWHWQPRKMKVTSRNKFKNCKYSDTIQFLHSSRGMKQQKGHNFAPNQAWLLTKGARTKCAIGVSWPNVIGHFCYTLGRFYVYIWHGRIAAQCADCLRSVEITWLYHCCTKAQLFSSRRVKKTFCVFF